MRDLNTFNIKARSSTVFEDVQKLCIDKDLKDSRLKLVARSNCCAWQRLFDLSIQYLTAHPGVTAGWLWQNLAAQRRAARREVVGSDQISRSFCVDERRI